MAIGVVELLLVAMTASIATYFLWSICGQRRKNFPPGPRGLPIVGCMPYVSDPSHKYFRDLAVEYGSSIVSVRLGTTDVVVLNDWKSVREALVKQSDLFSGRPNMFIFEATMKNKDIATTGGRFWKEKKRFTLQHLRDLGFGKLSMEEVIMEQVKKTVHHLEQSDDCRIEITHLFFSPIFNIVSKIVAGNTYEADEKATRKLSEAIKFNFECFKGDNSLNFMPYLRHVPGLTNFNQFLASHTKVEDLFKEVINEHERTYVEGHMRDFIDIYLKEIYKDQNKSRSECPFQKESLLGTIYNLYNAGVETTEHTLSFAVLYMALWPEIQSKVQAEIDQVVGRGRFPTNSDRNLLPFTVATILEVQRFSTSHPLSLPHAPTATTSMFDYVIPKGTYVLPNIWAVHNEPGLWGDPEIFRPERFLDEHSNVHKPEYLIPFSIGARFCLGEPLAKMELFLFFACLMQRFNFRCITGEAPPCLEPMVGLTQKPKPFSLIIKQRK